MHRPLVEQERGGHRASVLERGQYREHAHARLAQRARTVGLVRDRHAAAAQLGRECGSRSLGTLRGDAFERVVEAPAAHSAVIVAAQLKLPVEQPAPVVAGRDHRGLIRTEPGARVGARPDDGAGAAVEQTHAREALLGRLELRVPARVGDDAQSALRQGARHAVGRTVLRSPRDAQPRCETVRRIRKAERAARRRAAARACRVLQAARRLLRLRDEVAEVAHGLVAGGADEAHLDGRGTVAERDIHGRAQPRIGEADQPPVLIHFVLPTLRKAEVHRHAPEVQVRGEARVRHGESPQAAELRAAAENVADLELAHVPIAGKPAAVAPIGAAGENATRAVIGHADPGGDVAAEQRRGAPNRAVRSAESAHAADGGCRPVHHRTARARHERHRRGRGGERSAPHSAGGALGASRRLLHREGRRPRHRDAQLAEIGLDARAEQLCDA